MWIIPEFCRAVSEFDSNLWVSFFFSLKNMLLCILIFSVDVFTQAETLFEAQCSPIYTDFLLSSPLLLCAGLTGWKVVLVHLLTWKMLCETWREVKRKVFSHETVFLMLNICFFSNPNYEGLFILAYASMEEYSNKCLNVHVTTCSTGTGSVVRRSDGPMLEEKALQLLCCMKLQRKTRQGNLCCCLFVFTLWESKLSGNWSDVIRAMLRTRPAVKSCVRGWRRGGCTFTEP